MLIDVTGLVLTYNGQKHLAACLDSLSFCAQILVIDSQSTDNTVAIAKEHKAEVIVNPWPGPVKQFEFAFNQIKTNWVISLDQDEILSPELQAEIEEIFQSNDNLNYTGFYCPRSSFYFDRFLKHSGWYPDYLLRVFYLPKTTIYSSGPHYGFKTTGKTRKLINPIIHYPYDNLFHHVEKINYYTQEAARELRQKKVSSGVGKALLHGLGRFLKIYFLKRGFLDGKAGFILALNSFFYGFHKYIRILEKDDPTQELSSK